MNVRNSIIAAAAIAVFAAAPAASWAAPAPAGPATVRIAAAPEGNPKADPIAYDLLKKAHDSRQVLPEDFAGFDATIEYRSGDKLAVGTVNYRKTGETVVKIDGLSEGENEWVRGQVLNITGHRRGGSFAKGDGSNPLTLGKEPDNDFGKLIEVNDGMQSSYRVRDNEVTEVTRVAGDTRFTISVIQTRQGDPGKYLPVHFMVAYRNKDTGALQKVEGYRDSYTQVSGYWLPASRTVIAFGDATTPTMRSIRFKGIKLADPTKVAAAPAP